MTELSLRPMELEPIPLSPGIRRPSRLCCCSSLAMRFMCSFASFSCVCQRINVWSPLVTKSSIMTKMLRVVKGLSLPLPPFLFFFFWQCVFWHDFFSRVVDFNISRAGNWQVLQSFSRCRKTCPTELPYARFLMNTRPLCISWLAHPSLE